MVVWDYFQFASPTTKQINSVDIIMLGFELNFNNNAIRVGNDSSGDCETYQLGPYECTGSITCIWDAATDSLIADFIAGTTRKIQIAVGSAGVAGHLDFTIEAAKFTGASKDYGRPEGQAITLPFDCRHDGTNPIITVTLSDANDQGW